MASSTIKQTCAKCDKGGGIAMCNGCRQSFCVKHFIEHRQELSQRIDEVAQEHDLMRQDMHSGQSAHSLIARIDQWEQDAIRKVRASAETARLDLQQVFEQTKNDWKISMNRLTEELRACRESDDYTELDIRRWTEQLRELRQMIAGPSSINIGHENDTTSAIALLKVSSHPRTVLSSNEDRRSNENNSRITEQSNAVSSEKFGEIYGNIVLSADSLTGHCSCSCWYGSFISGIGRYSSGMHHIHFGIDSKISNYLFFGIITASQNLTSETSQVQSACGWWDLGYIIVNGKGRSEGQEKHFSPEDKITLILNCDCHSIQLRHHRTNSLAEIPIDLQQCPFPWKVVVRLDSKRDCIKILH